MSSPERSGSPRPKIISGPPCCAWGRIGNRTDAHYKHRFRDLILWHYPHIRSAWYYLSYLKWRCLIYCIYRPIRAYYRRKTAKDKCNGWCSESWSGRNGECPDCGVGHIDANIAQPGGVICSYCRLVSGNDAG